MQKKSKGKKDCCKGEASGSGNPFAKKAPAAKGKKGVNPFAAGGNPFAKKGKK
jgi:hypothetical protein